MEGDRKVKLDQLDQRTEVTHVLKIANPNPWKDYALSFYKGVNKTQIRNQTDK